MRNIDMYVMFNYNIPVKEFANNEPCIFKLVVKKLIDEFQLPIIWDNISRDPCLSKFSDNELIKEAEKYFLQTVNSKHITWFVNTLYQILTKEYYGEELKVQKFEIYNGYLRLLFLIE